MNALASTMARIVADPLASCRFLTTHPGCREVLTVEEFTGLARDDAAPDVLMLRHASPRPAA
ncbi:hypothetical protein ACIGZJ_34705 [Kitasatospora sp. NPDC052868]|uniref:hypothetical protein n=1 Tax=Kitasatospora sp. NPDC052868 TaxID=3364060 RepID=UPI0037C65D4E